MVVLRYFISDVSKGQLATYNRPYIACLNEVFVRSPSPTYASPKQTSLVYIPESLKRMTRILISFLVPWELYFILVHLCAQIYLSYISNLQQCQVLLN